MSPAPVAVLQRMTVMRITATTQVTGGRLVNGAGASHWTCVLVRLGGRFQTGSETMKSLS